jgi:hypothetical protein
LTRRLTASNPATQAETKIAKTTNSPALRSADSERSRKAMPRGIAVAASPKLWIAERLVVERVVHRANGREGLGAVRIPGDR